jgi:hypothetical protein
MFENEMAPIALSNNEDFAFAMISMLPRIHCILTMDIIIS